MIDDLEQITKNIQKKIGKETSSKIADDVANIMTIKANYEKEIKSKDDEIKELKNDKEVLITANGNLLQQVSMGLESDLKPKEKKEEKKKAKDFNFASMFDEKGNFIK